MFKKKNKISESEGDEKHKEWIQSCEHCGSKNNLIIHKKLVLCRKCHKILHYKLQQYEEEYIGNNRIKKAVIEILESLKIDKSNENFYNTPARVSRAYEEIFNGLKNLDKKLEEIFKTSFPSDYNGIVAVKNISVFSMCPHHLLPVHYKINIGIIYKEKMLGLSKIARFIDLLAKRPVLQETFTLDIIKYLQKYIDPKGIIVVVKGQHMCMTMRGIKKLEDWVITSSVCGLFENDIATRQEFFQLIK